MYWFCHRTCQEHLTVEAHPLTLRATWDAVRANRPLVVLCASSVVLLAGQFTIVGVQAHFAMLALGDSGLLIWMTLALSVSSLVMMPLAPRLSERFGVRAVYLALAVVSAAGVLGVALAPSNAPFVIACFAVQGLGMGPINALMYALAAECVDHGRRTRGTATPGAVYSTFHVARKIAQALGGGLTGVGLGVAGISAATVAFDPGAVRALVWLIAIIPAVLILAGGALILGFHTRHDAVQGSGPRG